MEEQIRRPSIDKGKRNCRSRNVIPTEQAKLPQVQESQNGLF